MLSFSQFDKITKELSSFNKDFFSLLTCSIFHSLTKSPKSFHPLTRTSSAFWDAQFFTVWLTHQGASILLTRTSSTLLHGQFFTVSSDGVHVSFTINSVTGIVLPFTKLNILMLYVITILICNIRITKIEQIPFFFFFSFLWCFIMWLNKQIGT